VSAGITPPFSLIPAHAPDLNPLASFGPSQGCLVRRVFAGCYVPLLGVGPSRRYLHSLCGGAWTLTPRRLFGALARFFPKNIGLTLDLRGSARSDNHQYTTLMAHAFRGCSHFFMFRLPHLLDPPVVPTAGNFLGRRAVYTTQWTWRYRQELWHHYVPESSNWHGGTFTR
jgi:hypothetical protein